MESAEPRADSRVSSILKMLIVFNCDVHCILYLAQLVECRVVMREVVSLTPAGPTLSLTTLVIKQLWDVKEPTHYS